MNGDGRSTANDAPSVLLQELSGHTTVVVVNGEHDLHTRGLLEVQLRRARAAAALVIDLTDCTFLDSTIIRSLLAAKRSWLPRRVLLVVPAEGSVAYRALTLVRIDQFFPTYDRLEDALAAAEPSTFPA
jgi:anti-anti-sigma factor